tara:strand:- start:7185 stop:7991 length:807 start_codon:yes stop_codon:yes gene_type:complete
MAGFFKQFPKVSYDFNQSGVKQDMVDIFRSIRPLPAFINQSTGYRFLEVQNGERPDLVSRRLYGVPDYYWTFFVVNDHLHDGYNAWPMSQEDLFDYINKQYEGYVVEVNPTLVGGVHSNSLSGKFKIGETITGLTSNATGTLKRKNADMCQLVIQDVTGVFIGDPTAINNSTELVRGGTTLDSVDTYRVFKYADAPYKYYLETDTANKEPVTNALHIPGTDSVSDSDCAYVTYRTYEFEKNEERSKIRYVHPNYIGQFVDKFKKLLNV